MFYDQLKQACHEKGTSPSALALAVGMSKANVTNWKNGSTPNMKTIVRLARELEVPVAYLFEETTHASELKEDRKMALPRMRTATGVLEEIKAKDSATEVTLHYIR